ncbi:MAG: hypothetical protein GTO13_17615 [Proteobacteria bacterium]|nr:hypothetical protein [Pseudomonadota bacterium]
MRISFSMPPHPFWVRSNPKSPRPLKQALFSDYYQYRIWSEDGIPTRKKLKELSLDDSL